MLELTYVRVTNRDSPSISFIVGYVSVSCATTGDISDRALPMAPSLGPGTQEKIRIPIFEGSRSFVNSKMGTVAIDWHAKYP